MNESDPFFVNFGVMILCLGEFLVRTGVSKNDKLPGSWVAVLCTCQWVRGKRCDVRSFRQRHRSQFWSSLLFVCVFSWVKGGVRFCAWAEFGLCELPGKYFVVCHCCLWIVQKSCVGGSGEAQGVYLTCSFRLFSRKKKGLALPHRVPRLLAFGI